MSKTIKNTTTGGKLTYGTAADAAEIIGLKRVQFFTLIKQGVFEEVGIPIRRHRRQFCLNDVRAYRDKIKLSTNKQSHNESK